MPFTPLHLGPGLAFKAVAGRRFSFMEFGLTQVLIDLEPLYYILRDDPPLHRFFHTGIGASLILILVLIVGKPFCEWFLGVWNRREKLDQPSAIPWTAGFNGAAVGVYSHVLLDSIMHYDVRPFAPFSQANPLHGLFDYDQMSLGCLAVGVFGTLVYGAARLREKRPTAHRAG
jgi:hypothetical protein